MADYIDREKLLEDLERFAPECRAAFLIIEKQEAVDAVPVARGRWVKKTKDYVYYYACSECSEPVPRSQWGNDLFSSRCPNCGARMDLKEESDA